MPPDKMRILVADDSLIIRDSISQLISSEPDMELVFAAVDGLATIEKTLELRPEIVLIDIEMPRCGALDAIPLIHSRLPEQKILVFSISQDEFTLLEVFRRGARGFIHKSAHIEDLFLAIRSVCDCQAVVPPRIASILIRELEEKFAEKLELTMDERRIFNLVSQGMSTREISYRLFINESAVNRTLWRFLKYLQQRLQSERADAVQQIKGPTAE